MLTGSNLMPTFRIFTVVNLTIIGIWLWGIGKNKPGLMLISLNFWALALCLWFAIIIYVIYDGLSKDQILYEYRDNHLYALTVFCVILYFVAIWSYKSIKRDIQRESWETQRFDVVYSVVPIENKGWNTTTQ
ncbi:uncharacterized protein LOC129571617 [Sitodiplosis mosellana]|uniref:uncharacterized protein LOC129571617 n=1 Tax=Sitodiplosis mosellana TaxID=263140 RepID=UPI0024440781|nr:uncharacterized protein LOC129571617 [Sitodiplosis mosellana]